MPNKLIFDGRLAAAPKITDHGKTKVARFRLIRNEYAGKDAAGNAKRRQVALPFAAFNQLAEMVATHAMVGDQLIVEARVRNNDFTDAQGVERYEYAFDISEIEFGAPGAEKRKWLAEKGEAGQ